MDALVDGEPATSLDLSDRGLHYGDGLFETIKVVAGVPRLWELHLARLSEGCGRLRLGEPDRSLLEEEVDRLFHDQANGTLKVILTRGSSGRGYRPQPGARPRRLLFRYPASDYPACYGSQGVRVRLCSTRLASNPALAGIKHLNRLEQVLARAEWDDAEITEGVMLDDNANVIEGTMTNLFIVRQQALFTPALERCGVAGVMRRHVMLTAKGEGLRCHEAVLKERDLLEADEIFLTNALIGIWPVRQFETTLFPVGPVTQMIAKAAENRFDR